MYLEHFIWSAAFAIIVGVIVERRWGYSLPIWIICASAMLPDIDYLIQTIMYPLMFIFPIFNPLFITHGDFHNIVAVIILSLLFAWLLNKYMKIDYNNAFICLILGCIFHIFCDYIVYTATFHVIAPRFGYELVGIGILPERGTLYGLGEPIIFAVGILCLIIALSIKFYYLENKWIEDISVVCEEF